MREERKEIIFERLSIRVLLDSLLGGAGIKEIECSVSSIEASETEEGCLRMYSMKWVMMSRFSVVKCCSKELDVREDRIEGSEITVSEPRTGEESAMEGRCRTMTYPERMIERAVWKRR
jgi:hypothetical protein